MTRPIIDNKKCAVCGFESVQWGLASTNRFGSPDLDTRPPEMMRSTMEYWIQECPECGYISEDLEDETDVDIEWLKSDSFINCLGRNFESELAKRFYKYYLINVEDNNEEDAFFAVLHAAWACDDVKDNDNAVHCRQCALKELVKIRINNDIPDQIEVLRADLLRRIGEFDELIHGYKGIVFSNDLLNKIIAFEIEKAKEKDTKCYKITDVSGIKED